MKKMFLPIPSAPKQGCRGKEDSESTDHGPGPVPDALVPACVFVGGEMERRTWTQGKLGRGEIGESDLVHPAHCWPGSDPTPPCSPGDLSKGGKAPLPLPSELLDRVEHRLGLRHRCVSLGREKGKKKNTGKGKISRERKENI